MDEILKRGPLSQVFTELGEKSEVKMRNSFIGIILLTGLIVVSGCSRTKGTANVSGNLQPIAQPSLGGIVGTVQVALGGGDVKTLAFKNIKLVQEGYAILTDSEKTDIMYDIDEGRKAVNVDLITEDEQERKVQSKIAALASFGRQLPGKESMQAIAETTTDAGGNFKMEGIKPGTYWVFLDTDVSGNHVGWAVKSDVTTGTATKVDLNNTNFDYAFR
jgi:hypothetical protein